MNILCCEGSVLPLLILLARRLLYKIHVYLHSVGVAVRTELIAGGIFARIMKSLHFCPREFNSYPEMPEIRINSADKHLYFCTDYLCVGQADFAAAYEQND
jgi:hypothetical protein